MPVSSHTLPRAETSTRMFAEAAEAPAVVLRQLAANAAPLGALAQRLQRADPRVIFTCARGSSDHAATFAKYLFESHLGIATVSYAPSLSSIGGGALRHMVGQPFIAVSQSGRSPDLIAAAQAARKEGALVIALVNDTSAPLVDAADVVIPLHAGPETSVAATKSYIAAIAAIAQLASLWRPEAALTHGVAMLPDALEQAWAADWSAAAAMLTDARGLFVLGRGLTLGIAQEAALKTKECCGLHGEAFSLAEVAHGPMALVGPDLPLLVLPPQGVGSEGLGPMLTGFATRGAPVAVAGTALPGTTALPLAAGLHPVTATAAMVQSTYRLINHVALARGLDPDHPPLLNKVTETR